MPLRYFVWFAVMIMVILASAIANPGLLPSPGRIISLADGSDDNSLDKQENSMLGLINKARAGAGLTRLEVEPALTAAARSHSLDMARTKFFSHHSPTNGDLRQRLNHQGVTYGSAGENIAEAYSVGSAHSALMESPGHRDNILNRRFRNVGIGIAYGYDGRLIITEEFTD